MLLALCSYLSCRWEKRLVVVSLRSNSEGRGGSSRSSPHVFFLFHLKKKYNNVDLGGENTGNMTASPIV